MSDVRTPATAPRRFGIVAILVAVALAGGAALMIYAVRASGGWFILRDSRSAPAERPPAEDYRPAPPQPAAGVAPAPVDPATLQTRADTLAAQIAALEARGAQLAADAAAAGGQAGRAEAVLVVSATRRALDRGQPLGYLEEQLRERFAAREPVATEAVIAAAHAPVTLEDLRQGLEANANELVAGGDGDILANLRRELANLVIVHRADLPSPHPTSRLTRARRLLDGGQVEAALGEVRRLPGASRAHDWQTAARRYVAARRGLDRLEAAALLTPPITRAETAPPPGTAFPAQPAPGQPAPVQPAPDQAAPVAPIL